MNLDDQIKNAVSFLLNYAKSSEVETVEISSILLKENGLDNPTFWKVICPILQKEASLEYSFLGNFVDNQEASKMMSKLGIVKELQIKNNSRRSPDEKEETRLELEYDQTLDKFHNLLHTYTFTINQKKLEEFYKKYSNDVHLKNNKESIVISDKGIFKKLEPNKKYGIRGKRFGIIKSLKDSSKRLEELVENRDESLVSKEIRKINGVFKNSLNMNADAPDLIEHSDSLGYYLNDDYYDFEFNLK
jgi:hypothetical protein